MRTMLLGALALLLIAPTATAQVFDDRCAEPCGYIVPIIDLDFPEKQACGGSGLVFTGDAEESDCAAVPEAGQPVELHGTITWYYDASEEPPYPKETGVPIVVSFDGTRNNPSWLDMSIEPSEFQITDADLANPTYFETEENAQGGTVLWYRYRQNLTVTFERSGDPTTAEMDRIEDRDGVVQVFLKARSTESSTRYRESFGVEEFRFTMPEDAMQATGAEGDNEAPGPALPLLGLAVGAAALRRRRSG